MQDQSKDMLFIVNSVQHFRGSIDLGLTFYSQYFILYQGKQNELIKYREGITAVNIWLRRVRPNMTLTFQATVLKVNKVTLITKVIHNLEL